MLQRGARMDESGQKLTRVEREEWANRVERWREASNNLQSSRERNFERAEVELRRSGKAAEIGPSSSRGRAEIEPSSSREKPSSSREKPSSSRDRAVKALRRGPKGSSYWGPASVRCLRLRRSGAIGASVSA